MYALMLLDRADLLDEFDTLAAAEAALARLVEGEPALVEVAGVVPLDARGRPAGEPIRPRVGIL